jgi:hypothetical protein
MTLRVVVSGLAAVTLLAIASLIAKRSDSPSVSTPPTPGAVTIEISGPRGKASLEECVLQAVLIAKQTGRRISFSFSYEDGQRIDTLIEPHDTPVDISARMERVRR